MAMLILLALVTSCEKEPEIEVIIPLIEVTQDVYDVDYKAGEIPIDFTSNVIFYANVDEAGKGWLSYKFTDSCQTLKIIYLESDTTIARTGTVVLSKGDAEVSITVNQAGNPNAGSGLRRVDIEYAVNTGGGYTVLQVAAAEAAKIPVGSTVVLECAADAGSINLMNSATYATYFSGGPPVAGKIKFVWTQVMAENATGGIMGLINDGLEITDMYCLYGRGAVEYSVNTGGGYTVLMTTPAEASKIKAGAVVVFECAADEGSLSLMDPSTYATYASGSPVNGKLMVKWTQEMVDITSAGGIMGLMNGGIDITGIYFIYVRSDLEYAINSGGGYTVLQAAAEEAHKIPIGATLVFECSSDAGSISLLDPATYAGYGGGAPVNGLVTVVWTQEMASITATAGIMGLLNDGIDITDVYCHN